MPNQDGEPEIEPLRLEYEAAKSRLNQQLAELEEFGRNTITRFRDGVVAIGVLFTAVSYLQSNPDIDNSPTCIVGSVDATCVTPDTLFAGSLGALVLGLVVLGASIGKESRGVQNTVREEDLKDVLGSSYSEKEYLKSRISRFESRIAENDKLISIQEGFVTTGGTLFLLGILGLTTLGYSVISGQKAGLPLTILLIVFGTSALVLYLSAPKYYMRSERPLLWQKIRGISSKIAQIYKGYLGSENLKEPNESEKDS